MSKAAEERARHEIMGKCVALTQDKEPKPCTKWASSMIGESGYCGTHAGSILNAQIEAERVALKRLAIDRRIDDYLAWAAQHPSVWDSRKAAQR